MIFYTSVRADVEANRVDDKIRDFHLACRIFFEKRNYGSGLLDFLVVLHLKRVDESSPFPIRLLKPFYDDYKERINPYTKQKIVIDKYFQYGILVNSEEYEFLKVASDFDCQSLIAKLIYKSFVNFEKLPTTVEFDKGQFIQDYIAFCKEWNIAIE